MHASDPVNRVMTEPVLTIGADESVAEALRLFAGYPVHHLPVLEDARVVGMLSSADVAKLRFFLPQSAAGRNPLLESNWTVRRIMRSPAITVTQHESVQRAAELMATNGVHCLPVVNSHDILIGILTTTDLMQARLASSTPLHPEAAAPLSDRNAQHLRVAALQRVAALARRYLNAGQSEALHTELRKAIEALERAEDEAGHSRAAPLEISG